VSNTTVGPFSPATVDKLIALGIPARDYDEMDLFLAEGAFMRWNKHAGVSVDEIYKMTPEQADNLRQYVYSNILPKIKQTHR
jgi:hypothetical protein